jgi:UDP-glucose 4-epimerase
MGYILVTGGAGFIGSYVVKELLNKGYKVIIVDNLKKDHCLFYVNPNVELISKDITDPFLFQILDQYEIDGVYHLAAQTSTEGAFMDPSSDIQVNSYGTWLIANYCKNRKIKRLIYCSTSAVFGSACKDIVDEETLCQPNSIYGVSKYSGELFIKQLPKEGDTKYTIFRFANIYGPGENLNFMGKGMVGIFSSFVWKKEPIVVRGSLERFRDFLFIEDTVEALVKAYDCENANNQVYVLSSGVKVYLRELIEKIIQISGNQPNYPVVISKGTLGDTHGFHADISKVCRDLDWAPRHSLEEGLKKFLDWMNKVPVTKDITEYHPFRMKENNL